MKFPGMPMMSSPAEMVDETADYAAHDLVKGLPAYQKLHAEAKATLLASKQPSAQQGVMGQPTAIKMRMSDPGMQRQGKK